MEELRQLIDLLKNNNITEIKNFVNKPQNGKKMSIVEYLCYVEDINMLTNIAKYIDYELYKDIFSYLFWNHGMKIDIKRMNNENIEYLQQRISKVPVNRDNPTRRLLFDAIMSDSPEEINNILRRRNNSINRFYINKTPLVFAVENGNLNVISELLRNGANVNITNQNNDSIVFFINKNNKIVDEVFSFGNETSVNDGEYYEKFEEILRLLVRYGVDLNSKNKDGLNPLFYYIKKGDFKITELLIKYGVNPNIVDKNKMTPLMYNLLYKNEGYTNITAELIRNKALINAIDSEGKTALMHLLNNKTQFNIDVGSVIDNINLLLNNNGIITICDFKKKNILTYLFDFINEDIYIDERDFLNFAKIVVRFLSMKISIDIPTIAKGKNGKILLRYLAEVSHDKDLFKKLIELGVKANDVISPSGKTIFLHAIENNDIIAIRNFINNGADFNIKDNNGKNALMYAVETGNVNVVKMIIDHVNVKDVDNEGKNALMYLKNVYNYHIIKVLLHYGIDINARDNEGKTALIHMVEANNHTGVSCLTKMDADVNIRDNNGKTALEILFENINDLVTYNNINMHRKAHMATYLIDKGADMFSLRATGIDIFSLRATDINQRLILNYAYFNSKLNLSDDDKLCLGIDINTGDINNKTIYMYASEIGDTKSLAAFKQNGADIGMVDNSGKNVFDYSFENDIFRSLLFFIDEIDFDSEKVKDYLSNVFKNIGFKISRDEICSKEKERLKVLIEKLSSFRCKEDLSLNNRQYAKNKEMFLLFDAFYRIFYKKNLDTNNELYNIINNIDNVVNVEKNMDKLLKYYFNKANLEESKQLSKFLQYNCFVKDNKNYDISLQATLLFSKDIDLMTFARKLAVNNFLEERYNITNNGNSVIIRMFDASKSLKNFINNRAFCDAFCKFEKVQNPENLNACVNIINNYDLEARKLLFKVAVYGFPDINGNQFIPVDKIGYIFGNEGYNLFKKIEIGLTNQVENANKEFDALNNQNQR